ncbi:MAG: MFS transporter [Streptosporangiaceae bacterium]|jgi:MFS family permease
MSAPAAGTEGQAGGAARGQALLDRMDRLPGWPLPRFDLFVLGLAYFFVFYDITDIGFGLPAIVKQFSLSSNDVKFVAIAIGLVGYIVGSNLIGALADRRGRRLAFLTSLLVSGLGSLGTAFATGIVSLSIWRFLTGMGVGAALNLASTYVGELSPPAQRGRISVTMFMIGIIGQAITPFVALALVPHFYIGWRLLFGIGALIGLAGVLFGLRLPESPRWLIHHGHLDKAEAMVGSMEQRFDPQKLGAAAAPHPAGQASGPVSAAPGGSRPAGDDQHRVSTMYELTHGRYGLAVLAMITMWFLWYIGNYGFLGDAATLLSAHGLGIGSSILYLAVGAIGYPAGAGIMILTADKVERKYLILGATVLWLIGMLLIGTLADGAVVTAGSFLASLALGSYLQVAYTFTAENFPTRLRARGFALADGGGHLGGAVGALLLPTLISGTTFFLGFAVIGITGVLAGLIALGGPKTSGRSLELIARPIRFSRQSPKRPVQEAK